MQYNLSLLYYIMFSVFCSGAATHFFPIGLFFPVSTVNLDLSGLINFFGLTPTSGVCPSL